MKVYMFYINKNRFKELFDIGYIPSEIPVVRDMLLYAYTKNKKARNLKWQQNLYTNICIVL